MCIAHHILSVVNGARGVLMVLGVALAVGASAPSYAKVFQIGTTEVRLHLLTDLQGAVVSGRNLDSNGTDYEIDWSVRGEARRVLNSGWLIGAAVEVDQDFDVDSDDDSSSEIDLDEAYLYAAHRFGRIELGRQDGPADALGFHAPIVGTGQVRGDFARYESGRALLTAFDTRDAAKVVFLSAPLRGLRLGVSYGPRLNLTIAQRHHVEAAVQYTKPVGPVVVGVSGTYVRANAVSSPNRQDLRSWSVGTEIRKDRLRLGAAVVSRGDSDSLEGRDEIEWNTGAAWRGRGWSAAMSYAQIERFGANRHLFGIGATADLNSFATLRGDAVYFDEDRLVFDAGNQTFEAGGRDRRGVVLLADLRLRY